MEKKYPCLSISKDGFVFDGKSLSLLEFKYLQSEFFNTSMEWEQYPKEDFNCLVSFAEGNGTRAFISSLDIWFSEDGRNLNERDYSLIKAFYHDNNICFDENNVINVKIDFDCNEQRLNGIKTEAPFVVYDCIKCHTKKVGLSRFHLYSHCADMKAYDSYLEKTRFEEMKLAVLDNHADTVKQLISEGADVNAVHGSMLMSPLDMAVLVDNYEICRLLINAGADVNYQNGLGPDYSMLVFAMKNKNKKIGWLLIANGYKVDLVYLQKLSNGLFEFAVKCGADPNQMDKDGNIPLRKAIQMNNLKRTALLINYGAEVNRVADNKTDLCFALTRLNTNYEIVKYLIFNGAKLDIRYDLKMTECDDSVINIFNGYINDIVRRKFLLKDVDSLVEYVKLKSLL